MTDGAVDRQKCARAEWPRESLLDHFERHARRDPRLRSVVAYERMARDTIRKGYIFKFEYHGMTRIGFYNLARRILVVVSGDQSRIVTCITEVDLRYVRALYEAEGAGKIVEWPNCPFLEEEW